MSETKPIKKYESPSIKLRLSSLTQPAKDAYAEAKNKSQLMRQALEFYVRLNKAVTISEIDKEEIITAVTEKIKLQDENINNITNKLTKDMEQLLEKINNNLSNLSTKTQSEPLKINTEIITKNNTEYESVITDENKGLYEGILNFSKGLSLSISKEDKNK